MYVVQLPRRNPSVSNQYIIEPVSPFAMNMKNFVTAVSWSCLKSREGYDLYYTNMQEAEANSRPAQCIRAMHHFMNAIVASKGVPELVDGRPLSFVASSLHPLFRRVSHCLGVECCISCRRVDWTLRKHPFISGVFFCPVCLVSYLCSTPIFNSLRKLRETSKKDDDVEEEEEDEEEDEEEEAMACLCCGRSTVRSVRVRDYQYSIYLNASKQQDINLEKNRVHPGASCGVMKCQNCGIGWCDPCLLHLGGGQAFHGAYYDPDWRCFVCRAEEAGSPCKSRRLIQIAIDQSKWNGSILRTRHTSRTYKDLRRVLETRCLETNRKNKNSLINLKTSSEKDGLTVLSLCSGLGSDITAIRQLGIQINQVYCVEIDDDAIECLRATHGDLNERLQIFKIDVRKFNLDFIRRRFELGPIDLITGGFPCQPFSGQTRLNLNTPKNFAHKSGRIVYKIALLLKKIQRHNSSLKSSAPAFFFENVRFDSSSQYISHTLLTLKQRYSWR